MRPHRHRRADHDRRSRASRPAGQRVAYTEQRVELDAQPFTSAPCGSADPRRQPAASCSPIAHNRAPAVDTSDGRGGRPTAPRSHCCAKPHGDDVRRNADVDRARPARRRAVRARSPCARPAEAPRRASNGRPTARAWRFVARAESRPRLLRTTGARSARAQGTSLPVTSRTSSRREDGDDFTFDRPETAVFVVTAEDAGEAASAVGRARSERPRPGSPDGAYLAYCEARHPDWGPRPCQRHLDHPRRRERQHRAAPRGRLTESRSRLEPALVVTRRRRRHRRTLRPDFRSTGLATAGLVRHRCQHRRVGVHHRRKSIATARPYPGVSGPAVGRGRRGLLFAMEERGGPYRSWGVSAVRARRRRLRVDPCDRRGARASHGLRSPRRHARPAVVDDAGTLTELYVAQRDERQRPSVASPTPPTRFRAATLAEAGAAQTCSMPRAPTGRHRGVLGLPAPRVRAHSPPLLKHSRRAVHAVRLPGVRRVPGGRCAPASAVVCCNPRRLRRAIRRNGGRGHPLARGAEGTIPAPDGVASTTTNVMAWPSTPRSRRSTGSTANASACSVASYGGLPRVVDHSAHTHRFRAACRRALRQQPRQRGAQTPDFATSFRDYIGVSHLEVARGPTCATRRSRTCARCTHHRLLILHSGARSALPHRPGRGAGSSRLRLLGRTPEFLALSPGEGHELSPQAAHRSNRVQRAEIILDFFRRHLQGRLEPGRWLTLGPSEQEAKDMTNKAPAATRSTDGNERRTGAARDAARDRHDRGPTGTSHRWAWRRAGTRVTPLQHAARPARQGGRRWGVRRRQAGSRSSS